MNLMTGSANPLYVEMRTAMLNAIDFETLARKFCEESAENKEVYNPFK